MKLKIKRIIKQKNKFGNDLLITMIGIYDDNNKFVKWSKLDDFTINILTNTFIKPEFIPTNIIFDEV